MKIERGMIIGFSKMGESIAIENIAEVEEYDEVSNTIKTDKCFTLLKGNLGAPQVISEFGLLGAISFNLYNLVGDKIKVVSEIEVNLNNFDFIYVVSNEDLLKDFARNFEAIDKQNTVICDRDRGGVIKSKTNIIM